MEQKLQVVPARQGRAVRLVAGPAIQIINTYGQRVVDNWCFNAADLSEFMLMEHFHGMLESIFPAEGNALITNHQRPIQILERDTSPGRHDAIISACDRFRYALLGCKGHQDKLHPALAVFGLTPPDCPSRLNLWMNILMGQDGRNTRGEPLCKAKDHAFLREALDCIVVMSACPQDMVPISGAACTPTEVHFTVLR